MNRRGILPPRWDPRRRKSVRAPAAGGKVELDTSLAVLVEEVSTAKVESPSNEGDGVWALELSGRLSGTDERAPSLFLLRAPHIGMLVASFVLRAREDPELRDAVGKVMRSLIGEDDGANGTGA